MAVYLIHFKEPISNRHTCQHYIGYAENVAKRVEYHRKGQSKVRLFEVAKERQIEFVVAYIWPQGGKSFERKLKNRHNHKKLCPVCKGKSDGGTDYQIQE